MAVNALKVLRDSIKLNQFDGAYYVYGEDEFQKTDAVAQLVNASVEPATKDFNLSFVNGQDISSEELGSLAGTPPMMANRRVIVVRDVTGLKKDARKTLDTILEKPSSDVTLILVAAAGAKADKALEKSATPLNFELLSQERLPKWITYQAKGMHNVEILPEAAELLLTAVGNDLYLLDAELSKLASFTNGEVINESAVSAVVGIRRGETVGDLLDYVLAKNASAAIELLPHILLQPKNNVVSLIMALSTQMLAIAWGRARVDDGLSVGRLESEYFNLLKRTGAFPMRPWGQAAKAWARAVPEWGARACDRAIDALVLADGMVKESRVSSEEQILTTTILAICAADKVGRKRGSGKNSRQIASR